MTLISSSRGERKSNQNLASFMGAPRSIVVCVLVPVLVLHMHDHFTVKLDNLPESSDARASPWNSLRCIYGIFESIFFRMTGRFNGPFVEILVSAIIGASWLLGTYVRSGSSRQHGALKGAERRFILWLKTTIDCWWSRVSVAWTEDTNSAPGTFPTALR